MNIQINNKITAILSYLKMSKNLSVFEDNSIVCKSADSTIHSFIRKDSRSLSENKLKAYLNSFECSNK